VPNYNKRALIGLFYFFIDFFVIFQIYIFCSKYFIQEINKM